MANPWKSIALGVGGAIAAIGVWSAIEPHLLNVEREIARIPNLPPAWEGQQLGFVTDMQIGMWLGNSGTARRAIATLIEARPAAAFLGGDFVYHARPNPRAEIERAVAIVRPLVEANIPTYAVLGNHDYGMSDRDVVPDVELANALTEALEAAGVEVLSNEAEIMGNRAAPLYVVAVDSHWANRDNVERALANVPERSPRVALIHNPDSFVQFPAGTAPLAVAGHTHGGQFRIPGSPQWSWLGFTQQDDVRADGWAKGYGNPGNHLYVNVGIGMSILPLRLFCPPEVTLFQLEADS